MHHKRTSLLYRTVPSFSHRGLRSPKSVPDDGFPVGIRCSCRAVYQTRLKKKKKKSLSDSLTLLLFQSLPSQGKIELCCLVSAQTQQFEAEEKAKLQSSPGDPQGQADGSAMGDGKG